MTENGINHSFASLEPPNSSIIESKMEFTPEHQQAIDLFKQGKNIAILGGAGVGKTTLVRYFIEECGMFMQQCSTTGIAAIQLPNGKTLHSALRISIDYPTYDQLKIATKNQLHAYLRLKKKGGPGAVEKYSWLEDILSKRVLLIDEISMCSAYLLECVDLRLRILFSKIDVPFGGMQVILVGDFLQLEPVYIGKDPKVHPRQKLLAFESPVWSALNIQTVLLKKNFRQEGDVNFRVLLDHIRWYKEMKGETIICFNKLLTKQVETKVLEDDPLMIMYKKADVKQYNEMKVQECWQRHLLNNDSCGGGDEDEDDDKKYANEYSRSDTVQSQYNFPYRVKCAKDSEEYKVLMSQLRDQLHMEKNDTKQKFCVGAKVMLTKNMECDAVYLVNGERGTIVSFEEPPPDQFKDSFGADPNVYGDDVFPLVKFMRNNTEVATVVIKPTEYKRTQVITDKDGNIIEDVRASIEVVPLILAYAITVHRCQGITVRDQNIVINCELFNFIDNSFYVAFSRAASLNQVYLQNYRGFKQSTKGLNFYAGRYTFSKPGMYTLSKDVLPHDNDDDSDKLDVNDVSDNGYNNNHSGVATLAFTDTAENDFKDQILPLLDLFKNHHGEQTLNLIEHWVSTKQQIKQQSQKRLRQPIKLPTKRLYKKRKIN